MIQRVALLGLSGVGKSTLIRSFQGKISLIHLQASALIKAEQARRAELPVSSEELRMGAVIDNQELLIAAFRREADTASIPIVFDGHSIIDGRDGLVEIPSDVFSRLNLNVICYLDALPEVILARRRADISRDRPMRSISTIALHQTTARLAAQRIARDIGCPFVLINEGSPDKLLTLLA